MDIYDFPPQFMLFLYIRDFFLGMAPTWYSAQDYWMYGLPGDKAVS